MPYASRCQQAVLDDLKGTLLICVHPLSVIFLACMANSLFLVCIWFLWAQSNSCCSQQNFPIGAIRPQCLFHVFGFLKKTKTKPNNNKTPPCKSYEFILCMNVQTAKPDLSLNISCVFKPVFII